MSNDAPSDLLLYQIHTHTLVHTGVVAQLCQVLQHEINMLPLECVLHGQFAYLSVYGQQCPISSFLQIARLPKFPPADYFELLLTANVNRYLVKFSMYFFL